MSTTTTTPKKLPKFEGRDVIRSAVAIRKAGDGLSDALKVEPVALRHGQRVFFVLAGEVRSVDHDPIEKDAIELVRTHVIDTIDIALVDKDEVEQLLDLNRERVQEMLDELDAEGTLMDKENGGKAAQAAAAAKAGQDT